MLGIFICLAIIPIGAAIGAGVSEYDKPAGAVLGAVVGLAVMIVLFYPVVALTGGLMPDYSEGERIGYVTKASTKGVIWKTNEIQVQIGAGEMAALQEPSPFSVPNPYLFDEIQGRLGDKAEIHYREWLIMPYWVGESGYEVVSVRWVDPPRTEDRPPEIELERE